MHNFFDRDITETNIYRSDTAYRAVMNVPGFNKDNINVEVEGNTIRIKGNRKKEDFGKFVSGEFSRKTSFERTLTIDIAKIDSDRISASVADGVLVVEVPLSESSKTRKIEIS